MQRILMSAAEVAALQHEHGVLLRELGRLQGKLGDDLSRLERENLRLRAALLVTRTAWFWGLASPGQVKRTSDPSHAGAERTTIRAVPDVLGPVLCRIACEGHAHFWLGEQGQCERTGDACERLLPGSTWS